MSWWGTIIGGALGYLLGGPLGALIGAALGRNLELPRIGHDGGGRFERGDQERVQAAFFTATFAVMGHLAKADGQVSKAEIRMAESVIDQMSLSAQQREAAIELFDQGKEPEFQLDEVLDQLRRECHRRTTLIQMFIEIQTRAAYADGRKHPAEHEILLRICDRLGYPRFAFEQLEALLLGGQRQRAESGKPRHTELQDAYTTLLLGADASDAEVKRSYRRLMSQHHPDKLVAKGLPEEMVKLANQKTAEIRQAYELIKESRGI